MNDNIVEHIEQELLSNISLEERELKIEIKGLVKYFYAFKKDFRRLLWLVTKKGFDKEFRVLNGVNFKVYEGEIVGILGKNGAGKSTLLKIISGVYLQTAGIVNVNGNVSSLLELSAGFNGLLTGRENIYLKAGVIGMSKEQVDEIIDDIIEFAGVGEYIDMPLLSYSSGMSARLGFALAINVDSSILIIDEVFAVGDSEFREKSKKKTLQLFEQGKTILFVSHSESLVRQLCTRVICIEDGFISFDGNVDEGLKYYNEIIMKK